MYVIQHLFLALGGITLFLLGLKLMSENMERLAGAKMQKVLTAFTKNRFSCVLTGAVSTALLQSSIATNVILVGFVSSGMITFYSAAAAIMGTNIGTTITAQLVSLSGSEVFDITAFGSVIAFIGFLVSFLKSEKAESVGMVMAGFGMLFFGIDVIENSVIFFKNYQGFRNIFLVNNDLVLLLNGLVITAVVQSSSAVTSVMIILASNGLIGFESSMFLILGANIGTCFSVILASLEKSLDARRAAVFNLAFNVFGTLILFLPLHFFKGAISNAFMAFSGSIEREIANFHTLFNLTVTLVLLPLLKPFTRLIEILVPEKKKNRLVAGVKTLKVYKG